MTDALLDGGWGWILTQQVCLISMIGLVGVSLEFRRDLQCPHHHFPRRQDMVSRTRFKPRRSASKTHHRETSRATPAMLHFKLFSSAVSACQYWE